MHAVLAGINWRFCLVYLDDIITFSKTFDEHIGHLSEVLERLQEAGLTLKGDKCSFANRQLEYLGHIISDEGISMDPKKVDAIVKYPVPKS
jgi:hypothetical protein